MVKGKSKLLSLVILVKGDRNSYAKEEQHEISKEDSLYLNEALHHVVTQRP
jgi:hypothetical protein